MRDRILGVATTLFYRQGYGGTSMTAIAAELDISAPAIYWHFKSKRELCFEAVHRELERFVTGLRPASKKKWANEQLAQFVSTYVILKLQQSKTLETPGAAGIYSQLREALTKDQIESLDGLQRGVVDQLRKILRLGNRTEEFHVGDVTVTAFAIISMCEYVFNSFDPDGPLSVDAIGVEYQALVLSMVGYGN